MKRAGLALVAAAVANSEIYFKETFDDSYTSRWVESDWKKSSDAAGVFKHTAGEFYGDAQADKGLQTSQDARFYAISSSFKEFSNKGKTLVIQFSVKHAQKLDCGGGYLKIFPSGLDQAHMTGDSEYNIMFGPDICGYSTKKVHVIFSNAGKNHLIKKNIPCEDDELTHVYTLIVNPDNTYEVQVDGNKKESGSLTDDWDILPPKKIKDPAQSKPSDWVDSPKMDDPADIKPEGYDDIPKQVVDKDAKKPEDWDDEADGDWEAPTIDNPEYKGPWKAKKIDNPDYKGPWVHPEIDNPEYVEDKNLARYSDIGAVGFDLWQVKSGTIFDNILVTDSESYAEEFGKETWGETKEAEKKMKEQIDEEERKKEEAKRKEEEANKKDDDDKEEEKEAEAPSEHTDEL